VEYRASTGKDLEAVVGLRIELKPFERIVIGESVITNSDTRTSFLIEGNAPILRERDILMPEKADTPVGQLYVCVQMMYLEKNRAKYQDVFLEFVDVLLTAVPQFRDRIECVSKHVLEESYYKALKELRKLRAEEGELLKHVQCSIRPGGGTGLVPT
jgi:flagellar biosynthesis repressor protein FlbT